MGSDAGDAAVILSRVDAPSDHIPLPRDPVRVGDRYTDLHGRGNVFGRVLFIRG